MSALNGQALRLRAGANVFAVSPDELQVAFPNYTATFVSPPVVKGVQALLGVFAEPTDRHVAIERTCAETGLEEGFLAYLVELLANSRCLSPVGADAGEHGPLADFYDYLGDDGAATVARLAAAKVVLVQGERGEPAEWALAEAGLRVETVRAVPGARVGELIEALAARIDAGATTIACWGVPYRLPLAGRVNDLALERRVPVLFGACEGVVGRVGPFVVPGSSSCLECLNRRLLSHAGAAEARAFTHFRGRFEDVVPGAWPVHPAFEAALLRLYALELATVVLALPPRTIGGVVETSFQSATSERHAVYRLPRCPSCGPRRPRRWAWDARLAPLAPAESGE